MTYPYDWSWKLSWKTNKQTKKKCGSSIKKKNCAENIQHTLKVHISTTKKIPAPI